MGVGTLWPSFVLSSSSFREQAGDVAHVSVRRPVKKSQKEASMHSLLLASHSENARL